MAKLNIELERNELRQLKMNAAQQLRTPENFVRLLILKNLGFIVESDNASENTSSDAICQDAVAVAS